MLHATSFDNEDNNIDILNQIPNHISNNTSNNISNNIYKDILENKKDFEVFINIIFIIY